VVTLLYGALLPWLGHNLGVRGVAIAFAFYWIFPFVMMTLVMWRKIGMEWDWTFWRSFLTTLFAALIGGAASLMPTSLFGIRTSLGLAINLLLGGSIYVGGLILLKSDDLKLIVGSGGMLAKFRFALSSRFDASERVT